MSTSELALRITLTKKVLRKAVYYNCVRTPWCWAIAVIVVIISSFKASRDPYEWVPVSIITVVIILLIPYSVARASLKSAALLAPITYTFSDRGVSAEYINGKNNADWSLVTGAAEGSGFIFIKMQRGSFHLIPKNQITDEEARTLRQILREHVQKNVSLGS